MQKKFVVYVDKPNGPFRVMEVSFEETVFDIENRIANFVSEMRTKPVPVGGINYLICIKDTPQEAANFARDQGLVYLSIEQMRQVKVKENSSSVLGRGGFSRGELNEAFRTLFNWDI